MLVRAGFSLQCVGLNDISKQLTRVCDCCLVCQQREVYEKTCKFLIPGVINGFNATVFAYGATGQQL